MDGDKRPRSEAEDSDEEEEEQLTMLDVLRDQRELEEEALRRTQEGWGDDTRCTYSLVCPTSAQQRCPN